MDLRNQLAAATTPASSSVVQPVRPVTQPLIAAATTTASWTLAADDNYPLPPAHLRELRTSSFPSTVHRNRGDYAPHATHILAAYRSIASLSRPDGMFTPPTDTMISFRVALDIPFDMTIPTAHGLYSVRLGSQGLSLSSFRPLSDDERLTRSSNNANFSTDFSSTAQPPQAPVTCARYDDIFLALSGLTAFANIFWYPHMIRMVDRIRRFVSDNLIADPSNPLRVTSTLQYANLYMGRAVSHLADDSPSWWRDFCAAVEEIEYRPLEWLLALQSLPAPRSERAPAQLSAAAGPNRRPPSNRTTGMPEHIRQLVPRRSDGTEPCLRFFGGGMCFGGSREGCAYSQRTHQWDAPLHRDLQSYINRQYGSNRRGHNGPRRS